MRSTSSRVAPPSGITSVTAGRPSVSVPVLSTISVCRRPACSSAAALRIRMPACAPRPVPTMIAVGVASPSAHGHAMTSTATACTSACVASPTHHHVAPNVTTAIADDHRNENAGHAIGQPLDRRLRALRFGDQPHDAGEQRAAAHAGRFARDEAVLVERARVDACARRLRDRVALAGQHALVDGRSAVADDAVDRDALARTDDEAIAGHHVGQRHVDDDAVAHDARGLRLQPQQAFERRGRAGLRARFQQLAQQHQRDDGRARLEVDVLVVQAEHGDHGAERIRHRRAQHDEHVHVRAAAAQRVPRADVEPAADPELDGRREHELQPARQEVGVRGAEQPARGEHRHHLQQAAARSAPRRSGIRASPPRTPRPCAPGRASGLPPDRAATLAP